MDLLLRVVVHGEGVVEPAVVGVPLLAVHHRVGGIVGLWQLFSVLHFDEGEVAALFLTRVLLLSGSESPTLDALFVFETDSWAGRTSLTGRTLEFGVSALAGAAVTCSSAITDLLITGSTCAVVQRTITGASRPHGITDTHSTLTSAVPSTQFVSRAITVEVVTLTVLAAVPVLRVFSLLALTGAAHTISIVAADLCTIVLSAGPVHVLCGYVIAATFTVSAHTSFVTLAGSTFEGPVTKVALLTVLNAIFVAFTLTDEVEGNLHLLCKSQGLDFNDLRLVLFGTALRCHTDAKHDLIPD